MVTSWTPSLRCEKLCNRHRHKKQISEEVEREASTVGFLLLLWLCGAGTLQLSLKDPRSPTVRRRVFVDGKPVPANQIVFKEGITYADAALLTQALGASVQNSEAASSFAQKRRPSSHVRKSRSRWSALF
jgi:hypothetical protein